MDSDVHVKTKAIILNPISMYLSIKCPCEMLAFLLFFKPFFRQGRINEPSPSLTHRGEMDCYKIIVGTCLIYEREENVLHERHKPSEWSVQKYVTCGLPLSCRPGRSRHYWDDWQGLLLPWLCEHEQRASVNKVQCDGSPKVLLTKNNYQNPALISRIPTSWALLVPLNAL